MSTETEHTTNFVNGIKKGVPNAISSSQKLTKNPILSAKENKEKMILNFNDALESGKWELNTITKCNLKQFKERYSIGIAKINNLVAEQVPKLLDYYVKQEDVKLFLNPLIDFITSGLSSVDPPTPSNPMMMKVFINGVLQRHMNEVLGTNNLLTIVEIIKPSLISLYGFTEKQQIPTGFKVLLTDEGKIIITDDDRKILI